MKPENPSTDVIKKMYDEYMEIYNGLNAIIFNRFQDILDELSKEN